MLAELHLFCVNVSILAQFPFVGHFYGVDWNQCNYWGRIKKRNCKSSQQNQMFLTHCVSSDVPGAVVDLKTVLVTKKNIVLTWSDPLDNGGSDIIGYEVLRKDSKMKLFRQPIETASCKCDIQGLLAGEEYDFRVVARNKFGDGAPADLGPILAEDPKGNQTDTKTCVIYVLSNILSHKTQDAFFTLQHFL